jgi:hypothetical protein
MRLAAGDCLIYHAPNGGLYALLRCDEKRAFGFWVI